MLWSIHVHYILLHHNQRLLFLYFNLGSYNESFGLRGASYPSLLYMLVGLPYISSNVSVQANAHRCNGCWQNFLLLYWFHLFDFRFWPKWPPQRNTSDHVTPSSWLSVLPICHILAEQLLSPFPEDGFGLKNEIWPCYYPHPVTRSVCKFYLMTVRIPVQVK